MVCDACYGCWRMLEVPEVTGRVLLRALEAVEDVLCLLEALEGLEVREVMRCGLLRMLEAVEGVLC